ncbi:unnamed protein product [Effrenium voratum]|nr:unnamed protein product [Effrenium voratum]
MSIAFLLPWRGIEPFAVPHVTQNQRFVRSGFAVSSLPVSVAAVKAFRVARKLRTCRSASGQRGTPLGNIFNVVSQGGATGVGGGFASGPNDNPFGGRQRSQDDQKAQEVLKNIKDFRMKPKDVKSYLDRFVMEQDEAKKVLSVALCDHYNWARRCLDQPDLREKNYMKPNILISGPTGSGKTYLVRTMAKMLGVPFVKADATKFSETGIVGEDAEDVVRQLVDAAGGSSEVAEYGMVYVDEVDKICSSSAGSRGGWSGSQVQSNFLKIMEDTEVSAKNSMQASLSSMFGGGQDDTISTKFVLFIFSGAFTGMNDIIKNRVGAKSIGFLAGDDDKASAATEEEKSYLHLAETKDFIDAGLEPEFIGRVPVRVAIRLLDAEDLYKILALAEDSVLQQFQKDFKGYGIELKAQTDALRRVAELAVEEKTGARALVTVMEKVLRDFKFELPSTSCTELNLTPALVDDPASALEELLCSASLVRADTQLWLENVEKTSNIRLDMPDEVRERVVDECAKRRQPAESVLDSLLGKTGEATKGSVELFCINEAMLEKPKEEMEKWTRELDAMA